MRVPFFRPSITEAEINRVVETLRSGWLTTGPRTREFETEFAQSLGAPHAVALNSCTAALHLALEALGLARNQVVVVPTMTFAATAEVVRYFDALPVFVDCDPVTLCMDPQALRRTLQALHEQRAVAGLRPPFGTVRAVISMHYGGQMADVDAISAVAAEFGVTVVEDAAHTLPAAYRSGPDAPWRSVGTTAPITCFSFYANKCITTGEGGMAVTTSPALAERMRVMSLHGLSKDAWKRFTSEGSWYYEIVAPGFKYNMTDMAASLGLEQLRRADQLWQERCAVAGAYADLLGGIEGLELPVELSNRKHSWHLYAVRVDPARVEGGRAGFIKQLADRGIGASVHWMPLHLHPYYRETYGHQAGQFPVAEAAWERLVSLPIFPGMTGEDQRTVAAAVRAILVR